MNAGEQLGLAWDPPTLDDAAATDDQDAVEVDDVVEVGEDGYPAVLLDGQRRVVAAASTGAWPLPTGVPVPSLIDRFDAVVTRRSTWAETVLSLNMGEPATVVNAATAAAVMLERLRREATHVGSYVARLRRYVANGVVPHGVVDLAGLHREIESAEASREHLGEIGATVDTWLRFQQRTLDATKAKIMGGLQELVERDWLTGGRPVVAPWWPLGGALRASDAGLFEKVEWTGFVTTLMGRAIEFGRAAILDHPSVQEELAARRAAAPFRSTFAF